MVDYCMCPGGGCPIKSKCYRFIAKPDEYGQAYFKEPQYITMVVDEEKYKIHGCHYFENEICEHYLCP